MAERKITGWFTMNGNHIPIYEGETTRDAMNRAVAKMNEDKKNEQIKKNKEQADKLNGKSEESNSDNDDASYIKHMTDRVGQLLKEAKSNYRLVSISRNKDIGDINMDQHDYVAEFVCTHPSASYFTTANLDNEIAPIFEELGVRMNKNMIHTKSNVFKVAPGSGDKIWWRAAFDKEPKGKYKYSS